MKPQTKEEILAAGFTEETAERATILFELLRPGLKIKESGRVDTGLGDKSVLGLYYMLKDFFEED